MFERHGKFSGVEALFVLFFALALFLLALFMIAEEEGCICKEDEKKEVRYKHSALDAPTDMVQGFYKHPAWFYTGEWPKPKVK